MLSLKLIDLTVMSCFWNCDVILNIFICNICTFFFLYFLNIFRSRCKLRSEARSQTDPSMKLPLKAGMKTCSCLFMGVRDSTVFLFSLYVCPPTLPKCHVVMPTSFLKQETGNDCTPTALSHTYRHTYTRLNPVSSKLCLFKTNL